MERKGMTEDCWTEVRRALINYDVVEKVDGNPDDHMEYWALVGYTVNAKPVGSTSDATAGLTLVRN
jgi:hypothetical protein